MYDEILTKAQAILSERERKETCLKAGICPVCGEVEVLRTKKSEEKIEYDITFFWRKLKRYYIRYEEWLECPKDNTHFKKDVIYDDDDYGD